MMKARKQIRNLQLPITLVHSENDEIVSKRSLSYFDQLAEVKQIFVPQSGHFVYSVAARDIVLNDVRRIIGVDINPTCEK